MKLHQVVYFLISVLFCTQSFSQKSSEKESPYELNWAVDGPYLGGTLGLNALGFKLIQDMDPLSEQQVLALSKDDVPIVDRWLAGNYSENANTLSDYPFYSSLAVPFVMMLTNDYRSHAGQISILFVETMATTGALFTITTASVKRSRPLAYNQDLSIDDRGEAGARRSFFAGHTAATASATFFAAKVFNDFNPDSAARYYVWAAAAIVPAGVGVLRSKAGKHFLTDNLVGYAVGAASGILIPEFHKKKNANLSFYPSFGSEYKGLSFSYTF